MKRLLIYTILISFLFIGFASSATSVRIADHGTDARNNTDDLIDEGNLTILIYDNESGGNEIFNHTYINGIINGSWNVEITANMEYGAIYWKDYLINDENLDYSGDDRLEFHSPLGYINNASFFNFSMIGLCSSEQSIRRVYENGTVVCEDDTDTHVIGYGYLYNDTYTMYVNGTTLNATIDARVFIDDTRVAGDGFYLSNDSTTMSFNEALLNITADNRDAEDNSSWNESFADTKYINKNEESNLNVNGTSWWAALTGWVSGWFYNSGGNLTFNETKLNDTIDARVLLGDTDTDTHVAGDDIYLSNDSDTMSFDEALLNATIDDRVNLGDTDTHVAGDGFYLTNNSDTMSFDETKLNATIDERDNDTNTHVAGDGFYLSNNSDTMSFDEALLNATIDERDNDTTYTGGEGIDITGEEINATLGTTINTTEIEDSTITDADISDSTNLTLGQKITFTFLETIDNVVNGWIRIVGNLNVTGNIESSGNVTADYFFGNGSQLTNAVGGLWANSSGSATFTSGEVGIGTTSPTETLDVDGSIRATEAYVFSDGSTQIRASVSEGFSWHVGSAKYSNINANVKNYDSSLEAIFFKPDGTRMYVLGDTNNVILEFDLSDPWNITSETYSRNVSVPEEASPNGFFIKPDGTKMYVVGEGEDEVNEYTLSDPWNVSSASWVHTEDITNEELIPTGIFFKFDGHKMYVIGQDDGTAEVHEYDLTTAWNLSSSSPTQDIPLSGGGNKPEGIFFRSDGTRMYISGNANDEVNGYILSTPWDISSVKSDHFISITSEVSSPSGLFFKPDGTKMYVIDESAGEHEVFEYDMGLIIEGRVGIGTTSPTQMLDVDGNMNVEGNYTQGGSAGYSGDCVSDSITFAGGIAITCN